MTKLLFAVQNGIWSGWEFVFFKADFLNFAELLLWLDQSPDNAI